jgi:hypothetical protein
VPYDESAAVQCRIAVPEAIATHVMMSVLPEVLLRVGALPPGNLKLLATLRPVKSAFDTANVLAAVTDTASGPAARIMSHHL